MKNILFNCLVFISLIAVSGCTATQYGQRHESVSVRFISEPNHLRYYVISILDNEELDGEFTSLKKEGKLLNFISHKNQGFADNVWEDVRPGAWVVMVDCGTSVTRRQVVFKDGLELQLRCR